MKRTKEIAIMCIVILLGTSMAWAVVSGQTTKVSFTCNGSTTAFACTGGNKIPCFANTDMEVYVRNDTTGVETLQVLTTNYTVAAFNNDYTNGFTVTMNSAPASGQTLVVKRSIALTQEVNLVRGRAIPQEGLEKTLDRQMLALQDSREELGRALRVPVTDSSYDTNLPSSVDRANKYLAFGASGDPTVTDGTTSDIVVSSWAETFVDDATAAAARITLLLTDYTATLNLADIITKSPIMNVRAYGATGDGTTDESTAVQAAIDAAITIGGAVYFPPGDFLIETEITISSTTGLKVFGAGGHLTKILCPTSGFSGDAVFEVNCSANGAQFSDFVLSAKAGGNFDVYGIKATGDGILFENLWLAGLKAGLFLQGECGGIRVSNVISELNQNNFYIDKGRNILFSNCYSYQATNYGYIFTGVWPLSGAQTQSAIVISGGEIDEDNLEGIRISTNVHVIINAVDISSFNNNRPNYGIRVQSGATKVIVSNCTISHTEIAGIYNESTTATVIVDGCEIRRVGYYDQSTPWACYGIYSAGKLIVSDTDIAECAGYGIYSIGSFNQISNILFQDCVQGGSDGGGVDATTGNKVLYFDAQATTSSLQVSNCTFEATAGSGTGKTAIFTGNTAVPVAGNLKFFGNHIPGTHFATNFGSDLSDSQLASQDFFGNYPIQPNYTATLADEATPSVKNLKRAVTGGTTNITDLDDGVEGQMLPILCKHSLTFDFTTAQDADHNLDGSSADITVDTGDVLVFWCEDGTTWNLVSNLDASADNN